MYNSINKIFKKNILKEWETIIHLIIKRIAKRNKISYNIKYKKLKIILNFLH